MNQEERAYIKKKLSESLSKEKEVSKIVVFGSFLNLSPNIFFNDFAQYINNGILNQHELMMDHYVEPMANFLKDYDSLYGLTAPSDDYYYSLALSGLESIITDQEMNKLIEAQNYFRNRGLNCN